MIVIREDRAFQFTLVHEICDMTMSNESMHWTCMGAVGRGGARERGNRIVPVISFQSIYSMTLCVNVL